MASLLVPMRRRKPFPSGYPYSILMKKAVTPYSITLVIMYPNRCIEVAVARSLAWILMSDGRMIRRLFQSSCNMRSA